MPLSDENELIAIGQIQRPFGVRGELRVHSLSDVPGRFEGLTRATLVATSGESKELAVRGVRRIGEAYAVSFEGIHTPEEAAQFRGRLVKIPRTLVPPLAPGEYYEFELLDLTVVDESGAVLGTLQEIMETPAHHVFVVRGESGEHLLPATKEVVRSVDREARLMTVRWSQAEGVLTESHRAV